MAADSLRHADILQRHPCFSAAAHFSKGRLHLPVSPVCNIQCRFCKRACNKWEARPGVARQILSPDASVAVVAQARELCPELTVVGIAGPGEALATDHAIQTFRAVHQRFPELIMCLSTNGLRLAARVQELVAVGVRTVTVTVNAVEPDVLRHICAGVFHEGTWLRDVEGARVLIEAQLAAIRQAARLGLYVKTNAVLIPGVNDHHIEAVAAAVKAAGASFINVIPLIPQHAMADREPPTCAQLNTARDAVERHLPAFRHCRQCRADACGIPGRGQDHAAALYDQPALTFSHG